MSQVFLFRPRPGRLPQSAPKDDPAWAYIQSAHSHKPSEPSYEQRVLRAHRIAAEVRDRRGMKVMKTCMASWAWTAE
jgi:hypothetical protein